MGKADIIPADAIEHRILVIRRQKLILDSDLAGIYGVPTARLNEQVKRNLQRFPEDFMFQLSGVEFKNLMSHFATSSSPHGGRRKLPLVFTEHGAIMAAHVLRSERAVRMSVHVVRAFVKLRETQAMHKELSQKLADLERKVGQHDMEIQRIIDAIRQLMAPAPVKPKRTIGFQVEEPSINY